MANDFRTLTELFGCGASDGSAILASGRPGLTYDGLRKLASTTTRTLNALGIGRNDRVAIVLPNGPEMATAFLAIGAGATTAPLNPAYKIDEFDFYLKDLAAKALVVDARGHAPAEQAAKRLGVPVLHLITDKDAAAGEFRIEGESLGEANLEGPAQPDDIALILHTSGTTSRPKIVPLSQVNLTASARHIRASLALSSADRCL